MNQIFSEPAMDQREAIHEAHRVGVHGFVPGLVGTPSAATVTRAFHDAEMARMRERCSRLAQMLAEALKG